MGDTTDAPDVPSSMNDVDDEEMARQLHREINAIGTRRKRQPRAPAIVQQPAGRRAVERRQHRNRFDASDDDGVPSSASGSDSSKTEATETISRSIDDGSKDSKKKIYPRKFDRKPSSKLPDVPRATNSKPDSRAQPSTSKPATPTHQKSTQGTASSRESPFLSHRQPQDKVAAGNPMQHQAASRPDAMRLFAKHLSERTTEQSPPKKHKPNHSSLDQHMLKAASARQDAASSIRPLQPNKRPVPPTVRPPDSHGHVRKMYKQGSSSHVRAGLEGKPAGQPGSKPVALDLNTSVASFVDTKARSVTGLERKVLANASIDRRPSTASMTDRKASTLSLTERKTSAASLIERKASTISLTERKASTASLMERNASTVHMPDRKACVASVIERKASAASVADRKASIVSVIEHKVSGTFTLERNASSVHEAAGQKAACALPVVPDGFTAPAAPAAHAPHSTVNIPARDDGASVRVAIPTDAPKPPPSTMRIADAAPTVLKRTAPAPQAAAPAAEAAAKPILHPVHPKQEQRTDEQNTPEAAQVKEEDGGVSEAAEVARAYCDLTRITGIPQGYVKCFVCAASHGIWLHKAHVASWSKMADAIDQHYHLPRAIKRDGNSVMFVGRNGETPDELHTDQQPKMEEQQKWTQAAKDAVLAFVQALT